MTKKQQLEELSKRVQPLTNIDLFELFESKELPASYFEFMRTCAREAVNNLICDTQARIDWNDLSTEDKGNFLKGLELKDTDREYFDWLTNYKPIDGLKWEGASQLMVAKAVSVITLEPEEYDAIISHN